jgi:amphiphysin
VVGGERASVVVVVVASMPEPVEPTTLAGRQAGRQAQNTRHLPTPPPMQALKTAKRRVVQKAAEAMGSTQRTGLDATEFNVAVTEFKGMEADLKQILDHVRATKESTAKWTAGNVALSDSLAQFFETDDGASSLREASRELKRSTGHGHDVVQRSVAKHIEDSAIAPLTQLLNETFPGLKKRIADHNNLKTDYSSYVRRLEGLKEKPVDDPERMKFQQKHDKALAEYESVHRNLMNDLRELHNERHARVRRTLVTLMAAQAELQSQLAADLNRVLTNIDKGDVGLLRKDIADLISAGGPPQTAGTAAEGSSKSMLGVLGGLVGGGNRARGGSVEKSPKGSEDAKSPNAAVSSISPNNAKTASNNHVAGGRDDNGNGGGANPFGGDWTTASAPPPALDAAPRKIMAIALFDYNGLDDGDLSFLAGDVITVVEKIDEGWWRGKASRGGEGVFPSNFVKEQPTPP